jgi:hypothetical protein
MLPDHPLTDSLAAIEQLRLIHEHLMPAFA